ncbi:transposase [Yersinia pseudotuberculosis]|nr:transposase [Yersinia pseudotuberculosis]MBO1606542.1 transposase [Yersinia pseudotuberculosis]MBO1610694.1 transposase [Yersinia pseudotuberculosis]MBO1621459.1 transposase [Yersinia pseudotuberculosis]
MGFGDRVRLFESVIGFGCYGFTAHLASDEPTANGAISVAPLEPRAFALSLAHCVGSLDSSFR